MKKRQRGTPLTLDDRAEVTAFGQWLTVQASRKTGAGPVACAMLEAALYPGDETMVRVDGDGERKREA